MAYAVLFTPKSMSKAKYDEAIIRLDAVGSGPGKADGLIHHTCFGEDGKLRVLDLWESLEKFQAFGPVLLPILSEIGIDPGEPEISEVHRSVAR
jgi:hypothetical protein